MKAIILAHHERPPVGFEEWEAFRIGQGLMGHRFEEIVFTARAVQEILMNPSDAGRAAGIRWAREDVPMKLTPRNNT